MKYFDNLIFDYVNDSDLKMNLRHTMGCKTKRGQSQFLATYDRFIKRTHMKTYNRSRVSHSMLPILLQDWSKVSSASNAPKLTEGKNLVWRFDHCGEQRKLSPNYTMMDLIKANWPVPTFMGKLTKLDGFIHRSIALQLALKSNGESFLRSLILRYSTINYLDPALLISF